MIPSSQSSAVSARETANADHPSRAARELTRPLPRPDSIVPSVTRSLYSTTVSRSLREALQRVSFWDFGPTPPPIPQFLRRLMRARSDESLMNSYVSLAALGCDGAFSGAVVATDPVSANADYDNGITIQRLP